MGTRWGFKEDRDPRLFHCVADVDLVGTELVHNPRPGLPEMLASLGDKGHTWRAFVSHSSMVVFTTLP
jgi:hypothetical protein